jgi:hypothetical protein
MSTIFNECKCFYCLRRQWVDTALAARSTNDNSEVNLATLKALESFRIYIFKNPTVLNNKRRGDCSQYETVEDQ